jgi:site-specific DNA-methyltransferase (adenine-specific)
MTPRNQILVGDTRALISDLAPSSVDCVVTSPPYFSLRDYGTPGQLGLESSVREWVDELRTVAKGLARALRSHGSLFLNLGDAYSRHARYGAVPKSLLLAPERLVLALVTDGWVLRNKIIWAKSNPQPSSVTDRFSATWEVVYFLVRSRHYYFDLDAVRAPHRSPRSRPTKPRQYSTIRPPWAGPLAGANHGLHRLKASGSPGHPRGKNPGDVITLATAGFRGAHFAVFPEPLAERPIRAACPERVCTSCGAPWRPIGPTRRLEQLCSCRARWRPGLVLDPFIGSGTVGVVAKRLSRDWLGMELNPTFARLARKRIGAAQRRPRTGE